MKPQGIVSWIALALGCAVSGGCSRAPRPSSFGESPVEHVRVDYATADGRVLFMLWSDIGTSELGNCSGGESKGIYGGYQVSRKDGRRLDWKCATRDGKTGTMEINGSRFDVAAGSVFLVKTKDGETTVAQHTLPMPSCPPGFDRKHLSRYAGEHEVIHSYLEETKG